MTNAPPEVEPGRGPSAHPDVDRGITPVAGRLGPGLGGKALALGALVVGCGVFLAATWNREGEKTATAPDQPARQVVPFEPLQGGPPRLRASPGEAPRLSTEPGGPYVPALQADASSTPAAARPPDRQAELAEIRAAPILAFSRRSASDGQPAEPQASPIAPPTARAAGATAFEQLMEDSEIGRRRASRLPDRNFLIVAGAAIPCLLQTAMDTATPGFVSCVIPQDIYSDNGAVVLLEKGTRVLGEYRGGLRQGQRRLFVIWTRAVTPAGVAIALGSPAADALGRAGFDGEVDTHFWDRFGGALLLSVVDDGVFAVAGDADRGETARLPSDAAAMAMEGSVAIAPTLRKAQGGEVLIFVAKDFDFSGVYSLRAR